ncbi:unnamed protein product [Soboliphyme baturini]|uniref:J domain-containing protein n=1 Tax=Soboliphyme baturini TaxID=241478 RepID=A0A183IB92_9BILA|nr:unnamed protein product [Soboliphyme baturini]
MADRLFDMDIEKEDSFESFYVEVKEIEKRDSVLTSKQQIDRLLRPGCTYFNLNPYEVLNIPNDTPEDEAHRQYRKLSILVHPDKNPDDRERAQQAFDYVKKAIETIQDAEKRERIRLIFEESKARLANSIKEKRRLLKKDKKSTSPVIVDEDDPEKYKRALWVMTTKVFAEKDRKRKIMEERDLEEKKRQHEEEQLAREKRKLEEEWQKNYEESRDERVNSWKNFKTSKEKKGKFSKGSFRPPKHKAETRVT